MEAKEAEDAEEAEEAETSTLRGWGAQKERDEGEASKDVTCCAERECSRTCAPGDED